jgi:ABC-type Mn2+/Zn2+ transport system ATPase subunit
LVRDQRFANYLATLKPEALDRLDSWFPDDSLRVTYSPRTDGTDFKPIEQGSPGQKTAAILAFLLAYGEEPIVLDQPEDDLDNHLIYDLIVRQVRETKRRRQIIVVTHNANIVVNGDAELVIALDVRGGQTRTIVLGGLQEQCVRDEICRVMEGGREAFELRYRRIALGGQIV